MATFNQKNSNVGMNGIKPVRNHEGAVVHQLTALETLFSKVLGSFFGEKTAYEKRSAHSEFIKLVELMNAVSEKDKEYVLKIAELGRLFNMIQFPLEVLTAAFNSERYRGESFLDENNRNKLGYYTDVIVRRTKDVNSILATQFAVYGRNNSLPKQLRKNLKFKLEQYDAYKLSKGLDTSKDVTLADAIKMLRPKPANKEMEDFYRSVIENNVVLGNEKKQIQTELTRMGQQGAVQKDNKDLKASLYSANLQALMKHLVNLLKNGVFEDREALNFALNKITDRKTVLASKLLPFRFLSAHRELGQFGNRHEVVMLREALEEAMDISVENVDTIEGLTAVLVDRSGSMRTTKVSEYSSVSADDVGLVLGAIAYKKGTGDLFVFANQCVRVDVSRRTPVLDIVKAMTNVGHIGGGTDLRHALHTITVHAKEKALAYDNLIILSDNDCYGYDSDRGVLTFGERYMWGGRLEDNADKQINQMLKIGVIKKAWINNLGGNDFAIVNTNAHTKNLITGFSEKFINAINIYNYLGTGRDIRKVIDLMLEKERAVAANKRG